MRTRVPGILFFCSGVILFNCGKKAEITQPTFTKADSLTDLYLSLHDSVLQSWNVMINDDNQKIKAMHNLLHELMISSSNQDEQLHAYEEQLEHLIDLRYTQQSMADEDLIEEYDFASNLLVTELITQAESKTEFAYNPILQKLVEEIRVADQRVTFYREEYDAITFKYNVFLEKNRSYVSEITQKDSIALRPLFQMTYGDN
jgi:hypothetical protein